MELEGEVGSCCFAFLDSRIRIVRNFNSPIDLIRVRSINVAEGLQFSINGGDRCGHDRAVGVKLSLKIRSLDTDNIQFRKELVNSVVVGGGRT